jgi:hypothetical protein
MDTEREQQKTSPPKEEKTLDMTKQKRKKELTKEASLIQTK